MRLFAVSDLHTDYKTNREWISDLSNSDYQGDVIIIAGDISANLKLLIWSLQQFKAKFRHVFYVPGNHDLWIRSEELMHSWDKFGQILALCQYLEILTEPYSFEQLTIVPLFSWYDYSFGQPHEDLQARWVDFHACQWQFRDDEQSLASCPDLVYRVTSHFLNMNVARLDLNNKFVISFSHFMPRLDILPSHIQPDRYLLSPVLGSQRLETQLRQLKPQIHIYGHSHINNRCRTLEGTTYINNAYGYPSEGQIASKRLLELDLTEFHD